MSEIEHPDPEKRKIIEATVKAGHEHVFRWWKDIGEEGKERLLQQLATIDFYELSDLYHRHAEETDHIPREEIVPAETISVPKDADRLKAAAQAGRIGEEAIRSGKVAVLLVAGGQATRLGLDTPKGAFKITPVKNKPIFQLHAEKILALQNRYGAKLPFYIMTSETNDAVTQGFFEKNNYFGLDPIDLFFFRQEMVPALDLEGRLILDAKDHIFMNPNGHGGSISSLKSSGALADMRARGIKHIFYFQVDNVLIKIGDPIFLGYHLEKGAEMSAKVAPKRDPEERVGVVCHVGSEMTVIEYSDLTDKLRYARNEDGSLRFSAGNLAIHLLDLDFVERMNTEQYSLPYHIAQKSIPFLADDGQLVKPEEKNGLKFEKFVFDALGSAKETVVMEVVREEEFAPVKNAEGEDSPASAIELMSNLYAGWLEDTGVHVPRDPSGSPAGPLEIDPLFALDASDLKEKLSPSFEVNFPLYLGPQ